MRAKLEKRSKLSTGQETLRLLSAALCVVWERSKRLSENLARAPCADQAGQISLCKVWETAIAPSGKSGSCHLGIVDRSIWKARWEFWRSYLDRVAIKLSNRFSISRARRIENLFDKNRSPRMPQNARTNRRQGNNTRRHIKPRSGRVARFTA